MPSKLHSINLLKNKETDFFGKFLKWTLTIGRLVVIITEIIALSAFVYRFSMDRQLIDLRNEIKQKQTIVAAQKESEERYRDLQDRIFLASNFASFGQERHKILKDILNLTPQGISLNNLALDKEKINIDANVLITSALSLFVNSLKNYPSIENISINTVENRPQTNFITVSITAVLKKSQYDIEKPSATEENLTPAVPVEGEVVQ